MSAIKPAYSNLSSTDKSKVRRHTTVSDFKAKLAFKDSLRFQNIDGDRQSEVLSGKFSIGTRNGPLLLADVDYFETEIK